MNYFSKIKRKILYNLKKRQKIFRKENPFYSWDRMSNASLDELFSFFNSDKNNGYHGYSDYYQKHLEKLKNSEIKILELGTAYGASAVSFYVFFNKSTIFTCDNHIENIKYEAENLFPILINSSDIKMKDDFYNQYSIPGNTGYFDIIIDDCSHRLSDMIKHLKIYFKSLKSGGYYIIEDYKFPNYFDHCNDVPCENTIVEIIENLNNKKFFNSKILSNEDQSFLFENIEKISQYAPENGIAVHSDICFIKKI